jgi:hypothetical protein
MIILCFAVSNNDLRLQKYTKKSVFLCTFATIIRVWELID